MTNSRLKNMVIAALLTAITVIIPMVFTVFPLRITVPPYTATLASHVPIALGMMISPAVAAVVALASGVAFFFTAGPVVGARALTHVVYALLGAYMLKKRYNIYFIMIITGIVHGLCEGVVVGVALTAGWTTASAEFTEAAMMILTSVGAFLHHCVDFIIAMGIYKVLKPAKVADFVNINFKRFKSE